MKTENTLENKAKFFAQYWGQHLIIMGSFLRRIDHVTLCNIENDDILQLKPLSKISDEDALILSKMRYSFEEYINLENGKCMVSCHENQKDLMQIQVDFLRSKGYALPYMDLSVEDLIDYGWVKLEE